MDPETQNFEPNSNDIAMNAEPSSEENRSQRMDEDTTTTTKQASVSDADEESQVSRKRKTPDAKERETGDAAASELPKKKKQKRTKFVPDKGTDDVKGSKKKKMMAKKTVDEKGAIPRPAPRPSMKTPKLEPPTSSETSSKGGAATTEIKQKKKRRWRQGTVAKREIRKLQKSTNRIIPKAAMKRVIRELTDDPCVGGSRASMWKATAFEAIHEDTEAYLQQLFDCAADCMAHAKRQTLKKADLELALGLASKLPHGVTRGGVCASIRSE